jgi:hypothetical protein
MWMRKEIGFAVATIALRKYARTTRICGILFINAQHGHMKCCASPTYRKRRRERLLRASRAGVAARERIRRESCADSGAWPLVRAVWIAVYAAPDGRHIELHAASERGHWVRCGSERAVRGALATIIWKMTKDVA